MGTEIDSSWENARLVEENESLRQQLAECEEEVKAIRSQLYQERQDHGAYVRQLKETAYKMACESMGHNEFNQVINHAIKLGIDADVFLSCWREGDWDGCKEFAFDAIAKVGADKTGEMT
jgi:hypothetical protein